jgi:cyclopropane-fatty-acyl-phospholipid synthase
MKVQAMINTHVSAGICKIQELGRSVYLTFFRWFLGLVVMRLVPDFFVRMGIRYLLSLRLKEVRACSALGSYEFILSRRERDPLGEVLQAALPFEQVQANKQAFVDELKSMPIAIETAAANEQHYEVCLIL